MFRDFILLIQALFADYSGYNQQVYNNAINQQMNVLQANYQNASASYNQAEGAVVVTTANGSIIVIDPGENN